MRSKMIVASGCTLWLCTAFAAPKWEIDEKALPAGITKQQAVELLAADDAATAELNRKEQALMARRAKELERIAKKYEPAYRAALAADPALAAEQAELEVSLKALAEGSDSRRARPSAELAGKLKNFRAKVVAKAKIDETELEKELGTLRSEEESAQNAEEASPRARVEPRGVFQSVTLAAPFPYSAIERNVGNTAGGADKAAGSYTSYANANWFSGSNSVQLAHSVAVPPGTRSVRVRAELPGVAYRHFIFAFGGGVGAGGRSLIQVTHSGTIACSSSKTHPGVWTVVAGMFDNEGTNNLFLDCTFASPREGTQILVKFTGRTSLTNVLNSGANAMNTGAPKNIRVDFLN